MKYLLLKKSFLLLISILTLSSLNIYAQNTYLSFKEGLKDKIGKIETMPVRTYQSWIQVTNATFVFTKLA